MASSIFELPTTTIFRGCKTPATTEYRVHSSITCRALPPPKNLAMSFEFGWNMFAVNDSFWIQSDNSSLPGRRIVRPKRVLSWKSLRCLTPNRGTYDVTQPQAVNLRKITSALFWFCPIMRRTYVNAADDPRSTVSNYLKTTAVGDGDNKSNGENNENDLSDSSRLPHIVSKTFTKKVLKRKCRPPLRNITGDFEKYENFLKAVSIPYH